MTSNKINFLFYTLGIAVSGILSFIFIPVVVQVCGKEIYATYSMIFNTLSIICMFCYGWVGQSFVRFYTQESHQLYAVSNNLLKKSLLIGFIFFIPTCFFLTSCKYYELIGFTPTFFLFGYYCFYLWVFQVKQKAYLIMICEVVRTVINIITTLLLLHFFPNQNAIQLLAISLLISYLIPLLILNSQNTNFKNEPNKIEIQKITKKIMQFGIPIALFLSGSLALSVNDRFIISYLINKQTAGTYAAIYDVINKGVVAVFSPVLMTFYPIIFKLYNDGNELEAFKKNRKLIWLEIIVMIVGFLILYEVSPYLLKVIFKTKTEVNLKWVACLIYIGVCLWQIAMLVHKPLELRQQTKFMALAIFIALVINATANYFIIKINHSLIVPAITTVVSSIIYILLVIIYTQTKKSLIINV